MGLLGQKSASVVLLDIYCQIPLQGGCTSLHFHEQCVVILSNSHHMIGENTCNLRNTCKAEEKGSWGKAQMDRKEVYKKLKWDSGVSWQDFQSPKETRKQGWFWSVGKSEKH